MAIPVRFPIESWGANSCEKIFKLIEKIESYDKEEITFDISNVKFFHPFGLNLFVSIVLLCAEKGHNCKYIPPRDSKVRRFLESIGFNKFFGVEDKKFKGFEGFSANLPIRWVRERNPYVAKKVVDVLKTNLSMTKGVYDSLVMSIQELLTNVFDHSQSAVGCFVCAQTYPRLEEIRACITDMGIGIRYSLERNEKYKNKISNDLDAIFLALKEGVSSVKGSRGLGLSTLEEFLKVNKGEITIVSGRGFLRRAYSKQGGSVKNIDKAKLLEKGMKGTAVEILVRSKEEGLYALASEIGEELF